MQRYIPVSLLLLRQTTFLAGMVMLVGLAISLPLTAQEDDTRSKAATADAKEVEAETEDEGETEEEEKQKDVAGSVTCNLVMTNEEKIDIDFAGADFVFEEQYVADEPPNLPENWEKMTPEEKQTWGTAFVASPAGKAYQQAQQKKFDSRRILKVIVDDQGGFELKNVPFGAYMLAGTIKGTGENDKLYSAELYANIPIGDDVDHIDHVDLKDLPFTMFPELRNGDKVPDVKLDALTGKGSLQLSKLQGKYVLLGFWATNSAPSVQAQERVMKAYEKHGGDKGKLQVVGISQDEKRETAFDFVKKKKYPWLQAFAKPDSNIVTEFGVQSIPTFWLIAPDGTVAATAKDFFEKDLDIEAVLDEKIQ